MHVHAGKCLVLPVYRSHIGILRYITASKIMKALLTTFALATATVFAAPEKKEVKPLELGAKAPNFKLEGTDGKFYTLDSFKDAKLLVVVFTCNHCPDARASRQRMNTFAKDYAAKGVKMVAISGNDPKALMPWELGYSVYGDGFEEMKLVAKEEKYVHPFLYDGEKQEASLAYGALATPHTFVFNKDRELIYHGRFDNGRRDPGPASENNVIDIVDAALAGKEIPKEKAITRPFGCSTKWSWKRSLAAKKEEEWKALPVTLEALTVEDAKKLAANKTEKIRIINFWSTTCGPCVAEFPELIDAYRRYQRRGVELITISLDPKDDQNKVHNFLKKQPLPLSPHGKKALAAEKRTTNNYHFQGEDFDGLANAIDAKWAGPMPHTVVFAPGGEVIFRYTGHIDIVEMRRAIVKQLEKKQKAH